MILAAVLFAPTGAFASDHHKHHHKHKHHDDNGDYQDYRDKQAQIEADRRANGYYDTSRYTPHHHHYYSH